MMAGHLVAPHRVLHLGDRGADVAQVVNAANRRLSARGRTVDMCRETDRYTQPAHQTCHKAAFVVGVSNATLKAAGATLTIGEQHQIRNPDTYRKASNLVIARARVHEALTHEHAKAIKGVQINGNTVTGGTGLQRVVAAAEHAMFLWETGRSNRFYSQAGTWTVDHGITGEQPGERSDCSQFVTSMFKSAGLPDPNGQNYTGGFTGTLWEHGHEIPIGQVHPACLIIYSTNATAAGSHHVEFAYKPPVTIGHGDAAVNEGTVLEMPGAHCFEYDLGQ